MQQPETSSLSLTFWIVLSRARSAVARCAEADVERHGLSAGEFAVLEVLYHKGALLLGDVQRTIQVSSGGITYLMDRLARKGLVRRRTCDHDRRACYAMLTDEGTRLMGRIFPEHAAAIERALASLTEEEKRTAIGLLRKLGPSATESADLEES